MQSLGLNDEEIKNFTDAAYWLDFFPKFAVMDLKSIGLHVRFEKSLMFMCSFLCK